MYYKTMDLKYSIVLTCDTHKSLFSLKHNDGNYTKLKLNNQTISVRCPGHTIHFLRFDYSKYIQRVLELLDIEKEKIDFKKYERWNPYED